MEFPTDKNFMYYEDNGDGTTTATVRFGEHAGTVVFPMNFDSMFGGIFDADFDFQQQMEDMAKEAVIIPDEPEDDA